MGLLSRTAKNDKLKGLPLFEHCSKAELATIAKVTDQVEVSAGRVLIREGERGRELFVLLRGEVEVRRKGRKLATLGPGAMVGEMALVSDAPRSATVTALSDLDVLVITDRDFRKLLADNPAIQGKVLRSVADRLAATLD